MRGLVPSVFFEVTGACDRVGVDDLGEVEGFFPLAFFFLARAGLEVILRLTSSRDLSFSFSSSSFRSYLK